MLHLQIYQLGMCHHVLIQVSHDHERACEDPCPGARVWRCICKFSFRESSCLMATSHDGSAVTEILRETGANSCIASHAVCASFRYSEGCKNWPPTGGLLHLASGLHAPISACWRENNPVFMKLRPETLVRTPLPGEGGTPSSSLQLTGKPDNMSNRANRPAPFRSAPAFGSRRNRRP